MRKISGVPGAGGLRFEGFKSRATFCVIFLTFDGDLPVLRGYTHDIVNKHKYIHCGMFHRLGTSPSGPFRNASQEICHGFFVCIRICTQECLGLNRPPFLQKKHPTVAPKKKSTPHFLEPNNFSERNISDEARWSFSQMPSILG